MKMSFRLEIDRRLLGPAVGPSITAEPSRARVNAADARCWATRPAPIQQTMIQLSLGLLLALTTVSGQQFTTITEDPVVIDGHSFGGFTWGDYDNDQYADLVVIHVLPGGATVNTTIYHNNRDGTFSRIPAPPGLQGADYYGAMWDRDNDGNQDLGMAMGADIYVGYGDGQGNFSPKFFALAEGGWPAVADYDRDGLLDMYWTGGNGLYHNQGNREFITYRGTQDLGPAGVNTDGGVCAGDFDDDGWPDLYVASRSQSRSYLFRNEGSGRFAAVTNPVTQTAAPAFQGAWGDYDNDGRLDLFVASWNGTSTLYRNLGNGQFERPADAPTLTGTHNFVAWADYDNDGFLDLWVSGYMSGNKLFRNNGDGSFTQVTTESIVTERPLNNAGTYQVAWFDYNNDGFLDAYLMNGDDNSSIETANELFRNNGSRNAWLNVRLIGTVSNRDAVGAKVRALATYAGTARWQRRDISGEALSNGTHRYAHFGLGDATNVTTLRIEWPSGIVQELQNVSAKQILEIKEPPQLVPLGPTEFQIRCWKGMQFEIQKSSNLKTWDSLGLVTNVTGTLIFQDTQTDPGTDCCFYRVASR
jgi:hypothetical protein